MTVNQFQYSKEEFIVISKQKQQTFKLNYSLIKYILCVFHLFMHVNNFSDDEMQLAITINQKHSHSGTWNITREHINVGFRSRGGVYFIRIPCTNSSSSCSFLFWRRKSVFVQNGFVHWGNITGLVVFRWGYVTSVWHGR